MKRNKGVLRIKRIMIGILCAVTIIGGITLASCLAVRATAAELDKPLTRIWTYEEAEMIAKTVWGEARGCDDIQKAAVVWCVLNRVDSPRFPDSVAGVITSPGQFAGYNPTNPVDEPILAIVVEALRWWTVEEIIPAEGWRILPPEYLYFSGSGHKNIFTTEYMGGVVWEWPGESDD